MPSTVINAVSHAMKLKYPLHFYKALNWLSNTGKKGTLAIKFKCNEEQVSIANYIGKLYKSDSPTTLPQINKLKDTGDLLTTDDVSAAILKLGNKAIGLDGLKDTQIKLNKETLVPVLTKRFNEWIKAGKAPDYITNARVVSLSKESTAYPSVGNIRTIAISPAITKLYEKAIYPHLMAVIKSKSLVHLHQRGFMPGCGTAQNIVDLIEVIKLAQTKCETDRRNKIKVNKRAQQSVLFIDFKRAFDSVDRPRLAQILRNAIEDDRLLNAVLILLQNTRMTLEAEEVKTELGVPQGGVLSPVFFLLYINELIVRLTAANIITYAYADDVVSYQADASALDQALSIIERWSSEYNIEVNKQKSAILLIKAD
jgi:hypothetical protein